MLPVVVLLPAESNLSSHFHPLKQHQNDLKQLPMPDEMKFLKYYRARLTD